MSRKGARSHHRRAKPSASENVDAGTISVLPSAG